MRAMQAHALELITLRREVAARYARMTRRWLTARNTCRRLHDAPVPDLRALRDAARRLDRLERTRAALMSDLKALSD
jgi:hypothetical protein